jgi:hypothetical protein
LKVTSKVCEKAEKELNAKKKNRSFFIELKLEFLIKDESQLWIDF